MAHGDDHAVVMGLCCAHECIMMEEISEMNEMIMDTNNTYNDNRNVVNAVMLGYPTRRIVVIRTDEDDADDNGVMTELFSSHGII